ncbi:unnamed protein product [Eruca vesicaria subsp. sativa]|uniref:Uncharacterized protein n=1 Tax=Eruca vesicaria subsp. sativa TaxID=29727 RepID=A0ABC8K6C4_ERUVS|nr:unnamed protein product [Eruca vesicaria subsp. sativa]
MAISSGFASTPTTATFSRSRNRRVVLATTSFHGNDPVSWLNLFVQICAHPFSDCKVVQVCIQQITGDKVIKIVDKKAKSVFSSKVV